MVVLGGVAVSYERGTPVMLNVGMVLGGRCLVYLVKFDSRWVSLEHLVFSWYLSQSCITA
jgi:hypothetical protein